MEQGGNLIVNRHGSYCHQCKAINQFYSHEFIQFDNLYSPCSITEYCIQCYRTLIVSPNQHRLLQYERCTYFINKPWYYGIYGSHKEGLELILSKFSDCGNEYWWEFRSQSPIHQGRLVQVITRIRTVDGNDFLNFHRNLVIYIVYLGDSYVATLDSTRFRRGNVCSGDGCFDLRFPSLQNALQMIEEYLYGAPTFFKMISKHAIIVQDKIVSTPLSLRSLSAIFIRSYYYNNKHELFCCCELPYKLKLYIAQIGVLESQIEQSDSMNERTEIEKMKKKMKAEEEAFELYFTQLAIDSQSSTERGVLRTQP